MEWSSELVGVGLLGVGGISGLLGGAILRWVAHVMQESGANFKRDLKMMRDMPTTSIAEAVREAEGRGLEQPAYVELSGESWTEEPLQSRSGDPVLAVRRTTYEKVESYSWRPGDAIFEERFITSGGHKRWMSVDTGRRSPGHWFPEVRDARKAETTVTARSGICFRELGTTEAKSAKVCVDLRKLDLDDLLQSRGASRSFEPRTDGEQVTLDGAQPPPRVLGTTTVERVVPLGEEVYALGNLLLRGAEIAGVAGSEQAVAVLQPKPGFPFIFGFGSESLFRATRESQILGMQREARNLSYMSTLAFCMGAGMLLTAAKLTGVAKALPKDL